MGTGLCILDTYIPKVCKGDYITVTFTSSILIFCHDVNLISSSCIFTPYSDRTGCIQSRRLELSVTHDCIWMKMQPWTCRPTQPRRTSTTSQSMLLLLILASPNQNEKTVNFRQLLHKCLFILKFFVRSRFWVHTYLL